MTKHKTARAAREASKAAAERNRMESIKQKNIEVFNATESLVNQMTIQIDRAIEGGEHDCHLSLVEAVPVRAIHATIKHFEQLGYRALYKKESKYTNRHIELVWSQGRLRRAVERFGILRKD